jgi:hypothetical protein
MYATEQGILNQQFNNALIAESVELEKKRPFMLLRPKLYPDGDQWCALLGSNLQEGVCGFGNTPAEAATAFDLAWLNETLPKGHTKGGGDE